MNGFGRPTLLALIISLLLPACAGSSSGPSETQSAPRLEQPPFVGKVWIATDSSAAPGTLRIFLADGTLVMDSCVETYRLARWESLGGTRLAWHEDTARIEAEFAQAAPDVLQLRLRLANEIKEENYKTAQTPYVCPDLRSNSETSVLKIESTLIYPEHIAYRRSRANADRECCSPAGEWPANERARASSDGYLQRFRKNVMSSALVKSMKNAPTSGTTRNALGAGP